MYLIQNPSAFLLLIFNRKSSECFNQAKIDSKHFPSTISKERRIILSIIYKAFVNFSNEIKCDDQLTLAFESILETLIELNYENAAVILDEFRLH